MSVKIVHIDQFGDSASPARCSRKKGVIYINDAVFSQLPPEHRLFVLLHEYGHIKLNTTAEFAVDKYASELYLKMGYPLSESVRSLSSVLSGTHPDHYARTKAQLDRAKTIDKKYNMDKISTDIQAYDGNIIETTHTWMNDFIDVPHEDLDDDFLGLGKKAQERRALRQERRYNIRMARQERKTIRSQGRADAKNTRALAKLAKQQAAQTLADQGISSNSGVGAAIGGIASGLLGGGGDDDYAMDYYPETETKSSNTWIYIAVGLVGAAIIGGLIYFKFKK